MKNLWLSIAVVAVISSASIQLFRDTIITFFADPTPPLAVAEQTVAEAPQLGTPTVWTVADPMKLGAPSSQYLHHGSGTAYTVLPTTCMEQFKDLPQLANRLGVKPNTSKVEGMMLRMCNGDTYNVFDLVNVVLDRLDTALDRLDTATLGAAK